MNRSTSRRNVRCNRKISQKNEKNNGSEKECETWYVARNVKHIVSIVAHGGVEVGGNCSNVTHELSLQRSSTAVVGSKKGVLSGMPKLYHFAYEYDVADVFLGMQVWTYEGQIL